MECVYGQVAPTPTKVLNPGSDAFFVPGSGAVLDFVQQRRQNNGRVEKKMLVKRDVSKDMNVTNYVRQVNEGEKNTYFYKLRRILPGLHDTRAGQPVGKILPQRAFKSVVQAGRMPVNGNYLRRVGKGTSENNDLFRKPYESTEGLAEAQPSYREEAYPMDYEETPQAMSIYEEFNKSKYRDEAPSDKSTSVFAPSTTVSAPSDASMAPSDSISQAPKSYAPSSGYGSVLEGVDRILLGSTVSAPDRGVGVEDTSMAPSVSTQISDTSMAPSVSTQVSDKSRAPSQSSSSSIYNPLDIFPDYEDTSSAPSVSTQVSDKSMTPSQSSSSGTYNPFDVFPEYEDEQVPIIGSPRLNPPSTRTPSLSTSSTSIGDARSGPSKPQRSVVSNPSGPPVAQRGTKRRRSTDLAIDGKKKMDFDFGAPKKRASKKKDSDVKKDLRRKKFQKKRDLRREKFQEARKPKREKPAEKGSAVKKRKKDSTRKLRKKPSEIEKDRRRKQRGKEKRENQMDWTS
jgi:hypothetical protein